MIETRNSKDYEPKGAMKLIGWVLAFVFMISIPTLVLWGLGAWYGMTWNIAEWSGGERLTLGIIWALAEFLILIKGLSDDSR